MLQRSLLIMVFIVILGTSVIYGAVNGDKIAIIQISKDKRIGYGIERLKHQLGEQGREVVEVSGIEDIGQMQYFIVGCFKANPLELRKYLLEEELNCKELRRPEGFLVKRLGQGQFLLLGKDEQGTMYACLDVAEQLRLKGIDELPAFYATSPSLKLRSYHTQFPTFVRGCYFDDNPIGSARLAPWFYDKEKVIPFLDKLAEAKLNGIVIQTTHPFAAIVPIPGYPEAVESVEEAVPLTIKKIKEQRIPYLRWLFSECRRRGIIPYIGFLNAFVPDSVKKSRKFERGSEIAYPPVQMEEYNRAALKAFGDTYGDLAGLFIYNGDRLPSGGVPNQHRDQNRWLRGVILEGLLQSANRPDCILWTMSGFLDPPGFEKLLKDYPNLKYLGVDHDGENITVPDVVLSQLSYRAPWKGVGGCEGTIAYSNMGGWGSASSIPYPWFSTSFLKRMGQHLLSNGIVGSTSFPMRGTLYPDYYERDWLWIGGLGKFLWDSSNEHIEYFDDLVKDRYGCSEEDAEAILAAYEKASNIPPLFVSQFYRGTCDDKFQFGAPLIDGLWGGDILISSTGMLLIDGRDNTHAPPEWTRPAPWISARGVMVDVVPYIKNNQKVDITPDKLADMLEADAKACLENIDKVSLVTSRKEEFDELKLNIQAYHYMGMHLSEKVRALLDMLRFLRKGDQALYDSGKERLKKSLEYYLQQRAVSQKVYPDPIRDLMLPSPGWAVPHDWDSVLPILRDEIDNYDKYLLKMVMHLAADRDHTGGPTFALRNFYRRVTEGTVEVWRPWWPKDPKDYWLSEPPKFDKMPFNVVTE